MRVKRLFVIRSAEIGLGMPFVVIICVRVKEGAAGSVVESDTGALGR